MSKELHFIIRDSLFGIRYSEFENSRPQDGKVHNRAVRVDRPVMRELTLRGESRQGLFEDRRDHLGGDDSVTRRRVVCLQTDVLVEF